MAWNRASSKFPHATTLAESPESTPRSAPKTHAPVAVVDRTARAPQTPPIDFDLPKQNRPTVESIQALASRNPSRALAIALAESDPQFRDELLQGALRGWASVDADAAADWARSQTSLESGLALAAVFNGAIRQSETALRLERKLSEEDPENAASYAGYLIFALGGVEKFALAAQVAARAPAEARTDLLTAAYVTWGAHHPQQALSSATEFEDPDMRRAAFQAVLGGWAKANPQQLTEFAMELEAGPERALALTTALRNWIAEDPAAVAEWAARAKFFPGIEATLEE